MISFDFSLGEIEFYEVKQSRDSDLINQLLCLEGIHYTLACKSPKNSYQLDSSLDNDIRNKLMKAGGKVFAPNLSQCPVNVTYDFALNISGNNTVFEIEKANKEKILYDFLKAHIYMEYNTDCVVIISPKNWVHKLGVNNLYKDAKERLDLCYKYKMGNERLKNILIVGYTQIFNDSRYTKDTFTYINKQCEIHFK
ncbi:MAG: hypothetical protein ACYCWE_05820 [Eubacteriales bacterium]